MRELFEALREVESCASLADISLNVELMLVLDEEALELLSESEELELEES
ncbi:hypothetical protein [uncultured Ilyobacter sp.]